MQTAKTISGCFLQKMILILIILIINFLPARIFIGNASSQEKIHVSISMHIENFTDAVKEAEVTRKVVELCKKYNMKVEFDISNWVSEEFQKCDPELLQMMKDMRLPLRGTMEQHLSFQLKEPVINHGMKEYKIYLIIKQSFSINLQVILIHHVRVDGYPGNQYGELLQ